MWDKKAISTNLLSERKAIVGRIRLFNCLIRELRLLPILCNAVFLFLTLFIFYHMRSWFPHHNSHLKLTFKNISTCQTLNWKLNSNYLVKNIEKLLENQIDIKVNYKYDLQFEKSLPWNTDTTVTKYLWMFEKYFNFVKI